MILAVATTLGLGQTNSKSGTKTSAKKAVVPTPTPTPSEAARFESAKAIVDPLERVAALKNFISDFPETDNKIIASEIIVAARGDAANSYLSSGDPAKAVELLTIAVEEAPVPFSERIFSEAIGKFPNLLFVNGQAEAAIKVADAIEKRSDSNARQLLALAGFHISTENSTAALRLVNKAVALEPSSSAAYQILGLAHRLNFDLEGASIAFAKAIELETGSVNAIRSLAEIKRATGKPEESLELFRQLLEKNADDPAAQAGEVLSLFDLGKRAQAEAAFDKAMKANPGNVALAGNVAFWYAVNGDAANAVLHAEEAIDLEPRYIWSHIALGRALMMQGKFSEAEQALIKARKYGQFPTLEYEIALARISSGFYRDALEDIRESFSASNDEIQTQLGGRVSRTASSFDQLLADERRASIFEPKGVERVELSQQLIRLIEFGQSIERGEADAIANSARSFASGSDPMQLHRQLFAASTLLDKQVAPEIVLELTKDATARVDDGIGVKNASTAVLAGELYERRRTAIAAEQFVLVPEIPKPTLSAVVRGRIEETAGWALYQQGKYDDAEIRLRRSITVLPKDSAWWRSSMWRLGAAQEAKGNDKDALNSYVASYRSEPGSGAKFLAIRSVYQRINGNSDDLETLIGPNPINLEATVTSATPSPQTDAPIQTPVETAGRNAEPELKAVEPVKEEKPAATVVMPEPTPAIELVPVKVETIEPLKVEESKEPKKEDIPIAPKAEPLEEKKPEEVAVSETKSDPVPVDLKPTQEPPTQPAKEVPKTEQAPERAANAGTKSLFDPVIITIPNSRSRRTTTAEVTENKPVPPVEPAPVSSEATETKAQTVTAAQDRLGDGNVRKRTFDGATSETVTPCAINVSQNSVSLVNRAGSVLILVGTGSDQDAALVTASSNSPADVEVRAEPAVEGISGRSLFLIRSRSEKTGLYQVTFTLSCGSKTVNVNVR